MSESGYTRMDPETRDIVSGLRARGATVFGPAPMSMNGGPAVVPAPDAGPGMHVQIAVRSRMVEGFGATGAEALRDALAKFTGYEPAAGITR